METQGSFLNGAEPSPPLPDATKEAEKEETREGEGGEEEQQQRVEEEDFPGEEEKKERSEMNKEEEGGDEEAPTTTTTETETDVKKAKKKKKGKKAVFNQVSPFVRNVVNLLRQAESTEPYFTTPTWRRTPFEPIPYKALKKYEPAPDMPELDAKYIEEKLNTSLPPGWTDIPPIPKEFQDVLDAHRQNRVPLCPSQKSSAKEETINGTHDYCNTNGAINGTTDVEKPQTLSFEELPAWAKWARPDVSNHVPLKLGEDIEIRHLWGMDCYTRAAVLAAVSQAEGYQGPENIKKREKFLTKKLMPKVHALREEGWDMEKAAQNLAEDSERERDVETKGAAECLIRAIKEIDEAEVHTKDGKRSAKDPQQTGEQAQQLTSAASKSGRTTRSGNNEVITTTTTAADINNSGFEESVLPAEEGPTDGIDAERTQTNGAATAMDVDENVDIVSAKNRAEVKNEEEEGEGEEIDPRTLRRHYRLHPKGVGVVCIRKEGLQPGMFVNHYLGEMYSPWRWYERCDAMKKRNPNQELPSFFNITLERPKDDVRGKDTVFVEAMHECEFASRMSHSCAGNCQTTVISHEGKLSIGVYTNSKIECGEELCWDYSCVTESEKEFRAAICLCSSPNCRGSFLSYAGSSTFTAVMNEKHNFLHRNAMLCRACSEPLTDEDLALLSDYGIRDSALNTLSGERAPDWLVKWASLILRYVQLEEKLLPEALCNLPMQKGVKYNLEGAKAETYGVVATRLQNIVVTLDKIKYFLRQPEQSDKPFMREATEADIIEHLWTGSESILVRAIGALSKACGILKNVPRRKGSRDTRAAVVETSTAPAEVLPPKVEEMDANLTLTTTEEPMKEEKIEEEEAQKEASQGEKISDEIVTTTAAGTTTTTTTTATLTIATVTEEGERENDFAPTVTEEITKEQNSGPVDDSTADDHAIAMALSEGYDLPPLKKINTNQASTLAAVPSSVGQDEVPNTISAKKIKEKKTTRTFTGNPTQVLDGIIAKSKMTPSTASEAKEWLAEVSDSIRNLGIEHCACADLLLMYARTQRWFTPEKFVGFMSPPVQLREHDPGCKQTASKISIHVKNTLTKKYQPHYPWGQMCSWFKQTIYDPTASLSADRRGTLSLPDVESAYNNGGAYVKTDRKQLFRILRENASRNWPTTMQWSFKNYAKMYGSPWFDDALRETQADFAALKKGQEQDMGMRETKEQTFGFLDEVEGLMSTGTTSSVGFARTFRKKKRGKTSAGIGKHKKETASVAKPGAQPKQPGQNNNKKKRSLNHLYAKGPDGKAFKCGTCRTCMNPKLKKRCINTPLLEDVDVGDVKVEDLAPGAVVYGTTIDSLMTMLCSKCQSGDDEEKMLICDGCDGSLHTYCVGLDEIPSCEHWFCDACAGGPKEKAFYERKRTAILQTKGLLPIPKKVAAVTTTTIAPPTTAEPAAATPLPPPTTTLVTPILPLCTATSADASVGFTTASEEPKRENVE